MSTTKKKTAKKVRRPKCKIQSNNIKAMREIKGLTQNELALLCNTNSAHISRIESGKRCHVSLPIALKIAKVLGERVEEVFNCNI